jgi:hypothetical protein
MTAPRFGHAGRLLLCCGSEQWEFGEALPPHEKSAVARELKRLTGARMAR